MELPYAIHHPPAIVSWAMLFLFAYPFGVWVLSIFDRADSGPMSASVVPATLTPLFVGAAMAGASLLTMLDLRGLTLSIAHSRLLESMFSLAMGASVAAFVSGIVWLRDRARSEPVAPRPALRLLSATLVALCGGAVVANLMFVRRVLADDVHLSATIPWIVTGISAGGAAASLIWLIASRRVASLQFPSTRRTIAAACACASLAVLLTIWIVVRAWMGQPLVS